MVGIFLELRVWLFLFIMNRLSSLHFSLSLQQFSSWSSYGTWYFIEFKRVSLVCSSTINMLVIANCRMRKKKTQNTTVTSSEDLCSLINSVQILKIGIRWKGITSQCAGQISFLVENLFFSYLRMIHKHSIHNTVFSSKQMREASPFHDLDGRLSLLISANLSEVCYGLINETQIKHDLRNSIN